MRNSRDSANQSKIKLRLLRRMKLNIRLILQVFRDVPRKMPLNLTSKLRPLRLKIRRN